MSLRFLMCSLLVFCLSPEQFSQIQHYREEHLNPSAEHKGFSQEG